MAQERAPDAAEVAAELRRLLSRLNRRLRQQTDVVELTTSQLNVLSRLERDGAATVSQLSRAEGVRPQSMGATVAALQASGFVRRDPHPTDGRKTAVSLTDSARELYAAHRLAKEDWLQLTLAYEFTPDELARLRAGMALLGRIADTT